MHVLKLTLFICLLMFTARAGVGSTHENCGICLDDLSESAVFKTTCNHKFHYKCIKNIAATNHNCPMCRNPNAFEVFDDFNFNEYFKESFEEAIGKIAIDENGEKHWVGGGRYFILSDKKSFTEKSDTFIYAIILASNTILKGVHGGIASTCVAYFQGSRIDEAFQKGCAAAMISNVGSIFAEMVLTGFSSVAVAIVSACSNDKKCTIAAKKFWAEAVKYSPILVCAVGGAMACHESGQDQKGALNGMVVGLFRIFREQIFPFTRLNRGYPETNNPDIARDFFTIYGLMIFVSAGVAGALSIHSNLLAGAINELFGLAQALNGINV